MLLVLIGKLLLDGPQIQRFNLRHAAEAGKKVFQEPTRTSQRVQFGIALQRVPLDCLKQFLSALVKLDDICRQV
jgi:hypothetical protein